MAHFAKIDENNVVLTVLGVNDEDCLNSEGVEEEAIGQAHLEKHNNWPAHLWIQTSYNTRINQHALGGTPFRGNYAAPGYTWDAANDCFWEIKPHSSWVKDIANKRWNHQKVMVGIYFGVKKTMKQIQRKVGEVLEMMTHKRLKHLINGTALLGLISKY
jgi:hypothetical protein